MGLKTSIAECAKECASLNKVDELWNGVTIATRYKNGQKKTGCWCEYGMTGRWKYSRKKKFYSCFFGHENGKSFDTHSSYITHNVK